MAISSNITSGAAPLELTLEVVPFFVSVVDVVLISFGSVVVDYGAELVLDSYRMFPMQFRIITHVYIPSKPESERVSKFCIPQKRAARRTILMAVTCTGASVIQG